MLRVALSYCILVFLSTCQDIPSGKINFDLSQIDENGLMGQEGGKVSVDYEFCIPAGEAYADEVKSIDPSIGIYLHTKGRIGCEEDQWLCLGNTHQKDWKDILKSLAALDYVKRIEQNYWE